MATKIQFYDEALYQREIAPRTARGGSPSLIANRDLTRYYMLLRRSLPRFTVDEALLLADATNGHLVRPETAHLLWAEVDDAIRIAHLDQKYGVDGPSLVARLRATTPFEQLAVADALEQAWNSPTYHILDMATRLRKVGLVREEAARSEEDKQREEEERAP